VAGETRGPGAHAPGGLSATAQTTLLESSPSPEAPQISGSMGLDGEEHACPSRPPEVTLAGILDDGAPGTMMVGDFDCSDFDVQGGRAAADGLARPESTCGQLADGTAQMAGDAQTEPPIPPGFTVGFTNTPIAGTGILDLPFVFESGGTGQQHDGTCAMVPASTTGLAGTGGDVIGRERAEQPPGTQARLDGLDLTTATRSTAGEQIQSDLSAAAEPQNGMNGGTDERDFHQELLTSGSDHLRTSVHASASRDTEAGSVSNTPGILRLPRQELRQGASSVAQAFESPISASQPSVGSMAGSAIPFGHGFGPTAEAAKNSEGRASPGRALNGLGTPRSDVCVSALGSGDLSPKGCGIDCRGPRWPLRNRKGVQGCRSSGIDYPYFGQPRRVWDRGGRH